MRRKRTNPTISAGSMADIAFLLLIFFLVSTTILQDKGISVILPPYDKNEIIGQAPDRNVLDIKVNGNNKLLVENELIDIENLADIVIEFISNPSKEKLKPRSPDKAIISIQHDADTDYETYIQVYARIKRGIDSLRDTYAAENFGTNYTVLTRKQKGIVAAIYPFKVSESEFSK